MEKIIELQSRRRVQTEAVMRDEPATIIIFPGIRYERKADEPDAGLPRQPDRLSN